MDGHPRLPSLVYLELCLSKDLDWSRNTSCLRCEGGREEPLQGVGEGLPTTRGRKRLICIRKANFTCTVSWAEPCGASLSPGVVTHTYVHIFIHTHTHTQVCMGSWFWLSGDSCDCTGCINKLNCHCCCWVFWCWSLPGTLQHSGSSWTFLVQACRAWAAFPGPCSLGSLMKLPVEFAEPGLSCGLSCTLLGFSLAICPKVLHPSLLCQMSAFGLGTRPCFS